MPCLVTVSSMDLLHSIHLSWSANKLWIGGPAAHAFLKARKHSVMHSTTETVCFVWKDVEHLDNTSPKICMWCTSTQDLKISNRLCFRNMT